MGRPSKLSEKQWEDVKKRVIAGEKIADLAKEFKVSKSALHERVSGTVRKEKDIATRILAVEQEFKALPVSGQISVISLADELRAISTNLAGAAKNGSMTAFRLSGIAAKQVEKVDPDDPMESQETLQAISALTKMSNEAASLGMNLMGANKETVSKLLQHEQQKAKTVRVINAEDLSPEDLNKYRRG